MNTPYFFRPETGVVTHKTFSLGSVYQHWRGPSYSAFSIAPFGMERSGTCKIGWDTNNDRCLKVLDFNYDRGSVILTSYYNIIGKETIIFQASTDYGERYFQLKTHTTNFTFDDRTKVNWWFHDHADMFFVHEYKKSTQVILELNQYSFIHGEVEKIAEQCVAHHPSKLPKEALVELAYKEVRKSPSLPHDLSLHLINRVYG